MNRKAKCNVYLRALQEQTGLTDEALQLIARVCGPRWDYNIFFIPFSTTGLLAYVGFACNIDKLNVIFVSCTHLYMA